MPNNQLLKQECLHSMSNLATRNQKKNNSTGMVLPCAKKRKESFFLVTAQPCVLHPPKPSLDQERQAGKSGKDQSYSRPARLG